MLKRLFILCTAALGGWMGYLWMSAHPMGPPAQDITLKTTGTIAEVLAGRGPKASAASETPEKIQGQAKSPASTAPGANLMEPPQPPRQPDYYPSVYPPAIPEEAAAILDPNDWPQVRSVLVAEGWSARGPKSMWWSNSQNGHRGMVVLSGAMEDGMGCRQFRITRAADNESREAQIAHVDVCRDGSIR